MTRKRYFQSGSIVRYRGNLYIVSSYRESKEKGDYLNLLSTTHGNSSTGVGEKLYRKECGCWYDYSWERDVPDPNCEMCHGDGEYDEPNSNIDGVEVVATCVMEFIERRMMSLFK
jgi:hypothetical protein